MADRRNSGVKQFGNTWWGEAWLDALEQRALVDPNRLPRGRTYARKGLVLNPELEPGLLSAQVQGTELYTTSLGVRRLPDGDWDVLLDGVVAQAKQAAALLSGDVPHELHDLLLPGAGDLAPDCTCPDWAEPCKHAAALCYVAADLLDADPFALLLLRGRGRDQVLSELRRRRAAVLGVASVDGQISHRPRGADPGVNAAEAYRRRRKLVDGGEAPAPPAAPVPARARTLPRLAVGPPADSGVEEAELRELVGDAARRAVAMLSGEGRSGLTLGVEADVARRAVTGDVAAIAEATGVPIEELTAQAHAFRHGGPAGLAATRHRWEPTGDRMQPGLDAVNEWNTAAAGRDERGQSVRPRVVARANTVSAGTVQLRLDPAGVWWRFEADDELGWILVGPPSGDPAELLWLDTESEPRP